MLPVLAVLWLYSLVSYPARLSRLPTTDDYLSMEKMVRGRFEPGDCLSLAPTWAERARLYLGDLRILGVDSPGMDDLIGCRRLLLLGVFEEDARRERQRLSSLGGLKLQGSARAGRLTLDTFDVQAAQSVEYDFREHIEDAKVWIERGSGKAPCDRFSDGKWKCPGPEWNYVGRLVTDVDQNPRHCIWAHPVQGGAIKISFSQVRLGSSIQGRHGIAMTGVGRNPSDVMLDVSIDGKELAEFAAKDVKGYFPFHLDTSDLGPGPHEVTFSVSTENNGARHYCFEAYAISRGEKAGGGGGG